MDSFTANYEYLLEKVFAHGIECVPIKDNSSNPFINRSHQRKFIAACHRGYERAQDRIIQILFEDLSTNQYN